MGKSDAIYEDFLTYDNGQSSSECPVNSAPCPVCLSLAILFP
jgi:hypothetical protein